MENVIFEWCTVEDAQFRLAKEIRCEVFVNEQGFPLEVEIDCKDEESRHVLLYWKGEAVGTARVFFDEPGVLHVGRLALQKKCRGKGFGTLLMQEIRKEAKNLKVNTLRLNAQHDKAEFYEKVGYLKVGDEFLEEGYPHVTMQCEIMV